MNSRLVYGVGVGGYTRIDSTGKSVVDYMLCSPDIFRTTYKFNIHNKFPESDHLPLSISINCKSAAETKAIDDKSDSHCWFQHTRYKWSISCVQNLRAVLTDEISLMARRHVEYAIIDMRPANELAVALNKYITQAADRTLVKKISKAVHKNDFAPWHDNECRYLRNKYIKAGEAAGSNRDFQYLIEKSHS